MSTVKTYMANAKERVPTLSVAEAAALANDADVQFVDVRESHEVEKTGMAPGAVHAPRGFLEFLADPASPMHKPELASGKRMLLLCASGGRSLLAANTLVDMGITNVASVDGGMNGWVEGGHPTES